MLRPSKGWRQLTQFRDDFNLEEILRQAFLPDDGPLRKTLPDSVIESWSFAANELGLAIEEAKLHPWFLSKARWYFERHQPPIGPGSPYDFPRIAAKTVKDVISRTIEGTGRGYVLGNNLRTPGARLKVTEISVELAVESAPYAYGLQYRHGTKGGPDTFDLKIFYTPTRHSLLMHIAKDCRSRNVIVPEDFEVILERYVGYMGIIDDYLNKLPL